VRTQDDLKTWWFFLICGIEYPGLRVYQCCFWRISAPEPVWHAPCKCYVQDGEMVAGWTGSKTMNFNIANLQQFAVSILGALITSSIFITAAVGPGAPIF
jgi:hypothetical protein